jgi:4'-phosphopantetheinyl transferase
MFPQRTQALRQPFAPIDAVPALALTLPDWLAPRAQVGLWRLDEPTAWFHAQRPLTAAEQPFYDRVTHPERHRQWLGARHTLRALEPLPPDVGVINRSDGRPYLTDDSAEVSLSHTIGYVGAMRSTTGWVGIDVENLTHPRNLEAVRLFMNPSERERFERERAAGEGAAIRYFLSVWTAKEALFKLLRLKGGEVSFREHLATEPGLNTSDGLHASDGHYQQLLENGTRRARVRLVTVIAPPLIATFGWCPPMEQATSS